MREGSGILDLIHAGLLAAKFVVCMHQLVYVYSVNHMLILFDFFLYIMFDA